MCPSPLRYGLSIRISPLDITRCMSGSHHMDSRQRRTSDKIGHLRLHLGTQAMCQTSHIRLCTLPRLHTSPRIQGRSTRLYHRFVMGLMSPHRRLHSSMREHTLPTPSQLATHRTRALRVPTAALSLHLADMARDHCIFLSRLQSLKHQPGQETCKCLAQHARMEDLMLRTD